MAAAAAGQGHQGHQDRWADLHRNDRRVVVAATAEEVQARRSEARVTAGSDRSVSGSENENGSGSGRAAAGVPAAAFWDPGGREGHEDREHRGGPVEDTPGRRAYRHC